MVIASCSGRILAYDREDGTLRWTVDARVDGEPRSFHGEMARTEDGLVLAGSDPMGGSIYAIRPEDGTVQWSWTSAAGTSSDLLVAGSSLVAVTLDHRVVALSLKDGNELWSAEPVDEAGIHYVPGTSSPVLWNDWILLARADGSLTRFAVRDGLMEVVADLEVGPSTDLTQVDTHYFLGLRDGRVLLLDPTNGKSVAENVLEGQPTYRWLPVTTEAGPLLLIGYTGVDGPERRLVALDASTLQVQWERQPNGQELAWTTAQPAILGPWVLGGHQGAVIEAIDPLTGEMQWELPLEHVPRVIKADGDDLWVGSVDGQLVALRRIEPGAER